MKYFILLIILSVSFLPAFGQSKWSLSNLQAGLSYNFLSSTQVPAHSPLGSHSSYEIENLKARPGFVVGLVPELKLTEELFLRTGLLFGYHVNSATMNYVSTIQGHPVTTSTNISTSFRNLYAQVPLEIAYYFDSKKRFGIFSGLKGGLLIVNASSWENSTITNVYDFALQEATLVATDTADQKVKPDFHEADLSLVIGLTQTLSNHFILEERINVGLVNVIDFDDTRVSKQSTFEIVFGWKFMGD